MNTDVIHATRNEVLRLLKLERNMIQETVDVIQSTQDKGKVQKNLTDEKLTPWVQELEGEQRKVSELEMTIAIVGTMKAGKSTTINAIVGREVLPNRNQPMTTLPTRITHTLGQEEPKLTFPKPEPFNKAIRNIKKKLAGLMPGSSKLRELKNSLDEGNLVDSINNGTFKNVKKSYTGTESIYHFLKKLNDISRLCEKLEMDSPMVSYWEIDDLPKIEVEFYHLKHVGENPGKLTLIDTPGPNEAGAQYLKDVVDAQIQKASAVIAVMNYTQLNTEADEEIKHSLEEFIHKKTDNLHIFVNRFDEKDRHGMDEKELKRYVQYLFDQKVTQKIIHPVSGKLGYLANAALREIDQHGQIPSEDEHDWVKDFANEIGMFYDSIKDQPEQLANGAKMVWEKSLYDIPLNEVITSTFYNAATTSMKLATNKMEECNKDIRKILGLRENALKASMGELNQHIQYLKKDIEKIESTNKEAEQAAIQSIKDINESIETAFLEAQKIITSRIESLFKKGKLEEKEQMEQEKQSNQKEQKKKKQSKSTFETVLNELSIQSFFSDREEDYRVTFDPNAPNVFEKKSDAEKFISELHSLISGMEKSYSDTMQNLVTNKVQLTQEQLWDSIDKKVTPVLKETEDRTGKAFDMELNFPKPEVHHISIDFDHIEKRAIEKDQEERERVRYKRKWYTLFLYEHRETYTYKRDVYTVDTRSFKQPIIKQLKEQNKVMKQDVEQFVEQKIRHDIDAYFNGLVSYLTAFEGELQSAVKNKELEKDELNQFVETLHKITERVFAHEEDRMIVVNGLTHLEQKEVFS